MFAEFAQAAKVRCPGAKALAAAEINLAARLP